MTASPVPPRLRHLLTRHLPARHRLARHRLARHRLARHRLAHDRRPPDPRRRQAGHCSRSHRSQAHRRHAPRLLVCLLLAAVALVTEGASAQIEVRPGRLEGDERRTLRRSEPLTHRAIVIGDSGDDEPRGDAGGGRRRALADGGDDRATAEAAPRRWRRKAGREKDREQRRDRGRATLRQALRLLRRQAAEAPQCRAYFADLGVDLNAWLDDDVPPYVYPLEPAPGMGPDVCGWAQTGEPFDYLFINHHCVERVATPRQRCELASLLLHEMGHLARRDVDDHEPPEFFAACRMGCVDPGRYH